MMLRKAQGFREERFLLGSPFFIDFKEVFKNTGGPAFRPKGRKVGIRLQKIMPQPASKIKLRNAKTRSGHDFLDGLFRPVQRGGHAGRFIVLDGRLIGKRHSGRII